MQTRQSVGFLFLFLVLPAWRVEGQVTGTQAHVAAAFPSEVTEVPSPMQVEVPLGRAHLDSLPAGKALATTETKRFWCDKARVERVQMEKKKSKKGMVELRFLPTLVTDWFRQDIDLTVSLVGADGRVMASRSWDNLTIGSDKYAGLMASSSSKTVEMEAKVPIVDLEAQYAGGSQPLLRIVVDIQGGEEKGD